MVTKKIFISIIFLIVSIQAIGMHKDRNFYRTYGNVKTYVKTPYDNYSVISDVEIIGKLAQKLAEGLSYKDTILLEFRFDYNKTLEPLILVENANADYFCLINQHYLLENIKKIQKEKDYEKNPILVIRQINNKFDIWNTLKLLEYCIQNKIDKDVVSSKYIFNYNGKAVTIKYKGLNSDLIKRIFQNEKSSLLETLSNEKIKFLNHLSVSGYYQNSTYFFTTNHFTYQADHFFFLVHLNHGICVFKTNDRFIYINNKTTVEKFHNIDSNGYTPIIAILDYNWYEKKELEKDEVILTRHKAWAHTKGFVFSETNNALGRIIE